MPDRPPEVIADDLSGEESGPGPGARDEEGNIILEAFPRDHSGPIPDPIPPAVPIPPRGEVTPPPENDPPPEGHGPRNPLLREM